MIEKQIIYQDNHLLVINKRAGQIVQGDKTGDLPLTELAKQYIKAAFEKPGNVYLGLPHRLDRPTSGVLVLAKTSKALERLNKLFASKSQIQKTYLAIVEQKPNVQEDRLEDYLIKNEKQNKSYVTKDEKNGKKAILDYQLISSSDRYHLLKIKLHTGRHHQIRVQLSNMGCIIKGDVKYGARRPNQDRSICLHAYSLELEHPVKKEHILFKAMPQSEDVLWKYFKASISQ